MYDVIVGEPLIPFSSTSSSFSTSGSNNNTIRPRNDHHALSILGAWDENESMDHVRSQLHQCFFFEYCNNNSDDKDNVVYDIEKSCIDLICQCLRTNALDRTGSMDEILHHVFWKDISNKMNLLTNNGKKKKRNKFTTVVNSYDYREI